MTVGRSARDVAGLPRVPVVAAATWGLLQVGLGLAWMLGAGGYPFETEEAGGFGPLLAHVEAAVVTPAITATGALTLAALIAAGRLRGHEPAATGVLTVLWLVAAAALLVVPDATLLAAVGYTPLLVAGAPFGWPAEAGVADVWRWPVVYQAISLLGGLALAGTAVVVARRVREACIRCGRGATPGGWTTPAAAQRWGRWAVGVAVTVPLAYAGTRFAWALGVPLGISEDVLREGAAIGLWWRGAALGALAVAGAGLTLGLQQRWGERMPQWLPLLGGRTVRPAAATVPALVAAALLTAGGLAFVRLYAVGAFDDFFAGSGWAVIGPELVWPAWGLALALAAFAYHLRRRGRCVHCGAGEAEFARTRAEPTTPDAVRLRPKAETKTGPPPDAVARR